MLTALEQSVMTQLLAGDHASIASLRPQLPSLAVTQRDHSGVGFFVHLELRDESKPISWFPPRVVFGDVQASIEGLERGAGFVLFVENGAISMLEGYSYDEPWPAEIVAFTLRYFDAHRVETMAALPTI